MQVAGGSVRVSWCGCAPRRRDGAMSAGTGTVHATCVAFGDIGILLRGPSGAGKSDLALRLIEAGAILVADDRVRLVAADGALRASSPDRLAGLLEVRGVGIVRLPNVLEVSIYLAAYLVPSGEAERLPGDDHCEYAGLCIRRIDIAPFEHSAVAKLRIAAYDASGRTDPVTGACRQDEDKPVK
jgi:HPr kinase/phosphorylase